MKLLFNNINKTYKGFEGFVPVQAGGGWVGIADVEDSYAKELLEEQGVKEITEDVFEWYKKKVLAEARSFRQFKTVPQESDKNPVAEYVEEVRSAPSESASPESDPKELVKLGTVEAEKTKPAPKKSRRAKK